MICYLLVHQCTALRRLVKTSQSAPPPNEPSFRNGTVPGAAERTWSLRTSAGARGLYLKNHGWRVSAACKRLSHDGESDRLIAIVALRRHRLVRRGVQRKPREDGALISGCRLALDPARHLVVAWTVTGQRCRSGIPPKKPTRHRMSARLRVPGRFFGD